MRARDCAAFFTMHKMLRSPLPGQGPRTPFEVAFEGLGGKKMLRSGEKWDIFPNAAPQPKPNHSTGGCS